MVTKLAQVERIKVMNLRRQQCKMIHNDSNMGERMTTMSPFERLMINHMDTFAENQMNLYDMCESRFSNMDTRFSTLDEQIEKVQR